MDIDSLRCFTAAADTLNFRAASKQIGLSPGAFSDRIRRLEDAVGTRLFERTTRRTHLTEAGHRLLPHAHQILEAVDACRAIATQRDDDRSIELTIGTRTELGISWLAPALGPLRDHRPSRTIHLCMGHSPILLDRTLTGELDATVSSARIADPRLEYATLHRETYALVGTQEVFEGPSSAAATTLLDIEPGLPLFRYLLDALPDGQPWSFGAHLYLGGIGAIRVRALAGDGVAVLPTYFIEEDLDAGRLQRLLPDTPLHEDAFRLVWRKGHPLQGHLLQLAEELRALPLR